MEVEGALQLCGEESSDSELSAIGQIDPLHAFVGFSPPSSPLKQQGVFDAALKLEEELKVLLDMPLKTEPKFEDEVEETNSVENFASTSNIKMSPMKPAVPKEYLLPFEMGWKRELNLYENTGNVVYIHPLGLRLRSIDDLTPHLSDGLTVENFSFNLEPLNAGPEYESITKDVPEKRLPAEMKDMSMIPTIRKSGRVPVPSSNYKIVERLEEQSRKRVADSPLPNVKKGKLVLKMKLFNSPVNGKPRKFNGSSSNFSPQGSFKRDDAVGDASISHPAEETPTITKRIRVRAQLRKKNTTSRKKNDNPDGQNFGNGRLEEISNWTAEKSGDEEPRRICTMACPKAMGIIPTLQCSICLCLYHPECAEVGRTGSIRQIHGYICKSCRNKPDVRKPNLPAVVPPPIPPVPAPTPKPSVPQHVVSYGGLRFVVVPNLGVTPAAATAGPALPPTPADTPSASTDLDTSLNSEKAATKKAVVKQETATTDMSNLISQACSGYSVLFNVFKYLPTKELMRASRVCRLWKHLSENPALWDAVFIKNCIITDWKAFATTLAKRGTRSLDLRKLVDVASVQWENGFHELCRITSLRELRLPRVSMDTVRGILKNLPELRVFVAQLRADCATYEGLDIFATSDHKLEVMQLKSQDSEAFALTSLDLSPIASTLTSLSLLNFTNWAAVDTSCIASLTSLTLLELGDCSTLPPTFANVLRSLTQLQRVRFETGTGTCPTIEIIESLGKLPFLRQLELINFDGHAGLDGALASLRNIHSFLLIPSFVTQAGTNISSILKGMYQLRDTLQEFLWVFTNEFLQVTELYIDKIKTKTSGGSGGGNIPILMPLPVPEDAKDTKYWVSLCERYNSGNFAVVPMSELEQMLATALPTTKTHIFKLPFSSTSRQTISELLVSHSSHCIK